MVETHLELQSNHVGAAIGFSTKKGEQVHAKVASSFILSLIHIYKRAFVTDDGVLWIFTQQTGELLQVSQDAFDCDTLSIHSTVSSTGTFRDVYKRQH